MLDLSNFPSPIHDWEGRGYVPQGALGIVQRQTFFTATDPALNAVTAVPWWLTSILDTTIDAPGTIRDWSTSVPGSLRLATAASAGSRRRLVGNKPIRMDGAHALYLTVGLSGGTGNREVTLALDNFETAAGAVVPDANRGVRITYSTATGVFALGYNNAAAGSEQVSTVILGASGLITVGLFPDTGHVGVWVGDQCVLIRRPTDLNVSASTQLIRPRVEIKALSGTTAVQDITVIEFAALVGGPNLGVALTAPDVTAPTAPSNLLVTAGDQRNDLTWTGSTDAVGVVGYRIYRGGVLLTTTTATSYANTGLTNGSTYSYAIRAIDAANNESASSNAATGTPAVSSDVTPPTVPATPVATAGARSASVTTTGSTDAVGVVGYRWYRSGTQVGTSTGTSFTENNLPAGTPVAYTVAAIDAAGNLSAQSAASNSVSPTSPPSFVLDTVTAADGTPFTAHTGETGATWTRVQGTPDLTITNNRAYTTAAGSFVLTASGVPASANYTVAANFTFLSVSGTVNAGIMIRTTVAGSGYALRYIAASAAWRLDRVSSGSGTALGTTPVTITAGATHRLEITALDSTLTARVDGAIVATATDTTFTSAGSVGLIANGISSPTFGIHIDNIEGI